MLTLRLFICFHIQRNNERKKEEKRKICEKNMHTYVSELIHWNSVAVINITKKITSESNRIS